jgi:hypothetical protein
MNHQASPMVRCENVAKTALANDDDVIKTFLSDRADQPLRISVLPRRPRRDRSVANAHGSADERQRHPRRHGRGSSSVGARPSRRPRSAHGQAIPHWDGLSNCRSTYERPHRSSYPGGIDRLGGRAILINHLCRIRCCREKRDSP